MANKSQIKKFLECKKGEVISKLQEESKELQERAKDKFFESYQERFAEIKTMTIAISNAYDELEKEIVDSGSAEFPIRHEMPSILYNRLNKNLSIDSLRISYIRVVKSEKIKNTYYKKIVETEREYNNLIALCSANKAVDAIKILENLGFDLSELEVKHEACTTLITNIDVNKLFIK